MDRQSLIAKIHMAKAKVKNCSRCGRWFYEGNCPDHPDIAGVAMPEIAYRETLKAIGGTDSCAMMDVDGLAKVADLFERAGYSKAYPYVSVKSEARRQRKSVIAQIYARAPIVLGENWEMRLQGFVKTKIGKSQLNWCDAGDLRRVIGWINRTDKYNRQRSF